MTITRQIDDDPDHLQPTNDHDNQNTSMTEDQSPPLPLNNIQIASYAMWTEAFGNFVSAIGSDPSLSTQIANNLNTVGYSIQAGSSAVVADTEVTWNYNKVGNIINSIGLTEQIAGTIFNIANQAKQLIIFIQGNLLRMLGVGLSALYSLEQAPTIPNIYLFYGNAIGLSGIFIVVTSEVIQLQNDAQATDVTRALNQIGNWVQVAGAVIAATGQSLTLKEAIGQNSSFTGSSGYAARNRRPSPYY